MKKSIAVVASILALSGFIFAWGALAQEATSVTTGIESVYDSCDKELSANSKLDPIRGKINTSLTTPKYPTNDMLNNESKPNGIEKKALRAYLDASIICVKSLSADFYKNDEKAQVAADAHSKKYAEDRITPLVDGIITYAEYNRHQAQDINDAVAKFKKEHRYWFQIDSWLSPLKPNYPANSPWWGFYSFAIATANDVDSGKILDQDATKMIEDRRVQVNQEIAASAAPKLLTLNCSMTINPLLGIPGAEEVALTIDYTNMKVNGNKADFYENEIRWSYQSNDGYTSYRSLNRLSGFYNEGLWTGHCAQATKQF